MLKGLRTSWGPLIAENPYLPNNHNGALLYQIISVNGSVSHGEVLKFFNRPGGLCLLVEIFKVLPLSSQKKRNRIDPAHVLDNQMKKARPHSPAFDFLICN